jgi:hypothetical protein|tara:strand:+ start:1918 stop:3240 length:1323 start_codon:yes stop_codon:yes gene_type:complete
MAAIIPIKYYNTYILKKVTGGVSSPLQTYDWYVEEARIRGGYNNVQTGLSPRAFLKSDNNSTEILGNSIIYSGVVNSRTGINQTNQFASGEDITRTVDPSKGSIQKLYAEDNNLIIFQERKVNKALIDKDAIYTQEGQPVQTASNVVIGAIIAYAGEFGISQNPESFAVYGYRKYFTDRDKGSVMRLSQDGLSEISNFGMYDYFRDAFLSLGNDKAIGGWDIHNKCYTLSLQPTAPNTTQTTLSFDENVKGWTSRFSYLPNQMFSVQNGFYSTKNGSIYLHYSSGVNRAYFYETQYDSTIKTIFNANPSLIKSFKTINYEGGSNWQMTSLITNTGSLDTTLKDQYTDSDTANPISVFEMPTTLAALENSLFKNKFKQKEDKYFANLVNTSSFTQGEVVYGKSISGVKGFFATVDLKATNTATSGTNELFSVSLDYNESSY